LIRPKYDLREDDRWRLYKPLEDTPDLLLKFSRLHEKERCVDTALDWAHGYGLLQTERPGVLEPEQETLEVFFREVDRAAAVLSMYEAVLNEDSQAAEWAARALHKK
jgi:hypothetical protein